MRLMLTLLVLFTQVACASAWRHKPGDFADATFDVAIVPGCPSNPDGTVSECQWRRALWAAALYEEGSVANLITSGGAVYNRYVEAEALAEALVALGVPRARVTVEPHAMHSDENAAFSLQLIDERGWQSIAVVSGGLHAVVIDRMLEKWGRTAVGLPLDPFLVDRWLALGTPTVRTSPVPAEDWTTLEERHAQRALASGTTRGASLPLYLRRALDPSATAPLVASPPEVSVRGAAFR